MACTGSGTTIAFTDWNFVGRVTSIAGLDEEVDIIDDDELATVGDMEYCPGAKRRRSPIEVEFVYDPDSPPRAGQLDANTIITFLPKAGQATGARIAGSSFLSRVVHGAASSDERLLATLEVLFDGKTPPTFTPGS